MFQVRVPFGCFILMGFHESESIDDQRISAFPLHFLFSVKPKSETWKLHNNGRLYPTDDVTFSTYPSSSLTWLAKV